MDLRGNVRLIRGRARLNSRIIPGLIIVLLGVLLTLHNFGFFAIERAWRFWPLLIVALGIHRIWEPGGSRRGSGFLLLAVGVAAQLYNLGLFHMSVEHVRRYWPLLLIAVGLDMVWRSRRHGGLGLGLLVLFLGAWFQLETFGLIGFPLWRLWPLVLVAIGLSMVQKAWRRRIWR